MLSEDFLNNLLEEFSKRLQGRGVVPGQNCSDCPMSLPITTPEIVLIGLKAETKEGAVAQMAQALLEAGRISGLDEYLSAVAAREEHFPTGIEGGIAIPHAQSDLVLVPSVAVATAPDGVDFGADDGPATLIFLIAAPASGENTHLEILASLARKIMHEDFRELLRSQADAAAIAELVTKEVQP